MAIWVEPGSETPQNICGTAPRGPDVSNPTEGLSATEWCTRRIRTHTPRRALRRSEKVCPPDPSVPAGAQGAKVLTRARSRRMHAPLLPQSLLPDMIDCPMYRSAWRDFVMSVQRHDCTPKCAGKGPDGKCKYMYPRDFLGDACCYNATTDRYDYRTELEEDRRLSPYVPLWLLATGASMNVSCQHPIACSCHQPKAPTLPQC
jgi:hypothetical protein